MCRYVLKNLVRDWSADGAAEREESYGRILVKLCDHYQVELLLRPVLLLTLCQLQTCSASSCT